MESISTLEHLSLSTTASSASSGEFRLAKRPVMAAGGRIGRDITLYTNFFPVRIRADNSIYNYSVAFVPPIEGSLTPVKRRIFYQLEDTLTLKFGPHIFTGGNLFSTKDIGEAPHMIQSETPTTDDPDMTYVVQLLKVAALELDDILNPEKYNKKAETARQFFNVIVKKILRAGNLQPLGRIQKYFLESKAKRIEEFKMEVWPGYKTSINYLQGGLLLDIDYASKLLRTESVMACMDEIYNNCGTMEEYQQQCRQAIEGHSVLVRYGNKRLYVVDKIEFEKTPQTEIFTTPEGKDINLMNYYETRYGIKIKNSEQSLLLNIDRRTEKPRYLIPELCSMTGMPDQMKEDFRVMKQVALYTKLTPDARVKEMQNLLQLFYSSNVKDNKGKLMKTQPKTILDEWKIDFAKTPIEVKGRVLPPQELIAKDKKITLDSTGQFQFRNKVFQPKNLEKWLIVHTTRDYSTAESLVDNLYTAAQTFGIKVEFPVYAQAQGMRARNYIQAIEDNWQSDFQLVVCLLPPPAKNSYGELKTYMNSKSIISQMVVTKTLQKNILSCCSKIILQINAKLDGDLYHLTLPNELKGKIVMVVGIDVSREAGRSVICMSSSIDPFFCKYKTQVAFLKPKQEIAASLSTFIKQAIKSLFEATKKKFLPAYIIVYRDGVGEGQKPALFQTELQSIQTAIGGIKPDYAPKLLFCTVNKKIHTRFFQKSSGSYGPARGGGKPSGGRGVENLSNPPSGTIVDSTIVRKEDYEFLLMPQFVNQGTGTPSHFQVLYDDTGFSGDCFQCFTNTLCYGYYNWTGAIRTPAPCKYAFTCAKLVAKHIQKQPNETMRQNLYYL
jgi:aubergine